MKINNLEDIEEKYAMVLADPPWRYNDILKLQNEGSAINYNTMSMDEIKKLPIDKITKKDSILFLWVTMPMLREGLEVISSWGFKYRTCIQCWVKQNPKSKTIFKGIGRWVMGNAELCLLAIKGKPKRITMDIPQICLSPRREHSRKPDEVKERAVKLMGDIPRIELFARESQDGWDSWGNETEKFTHLKKLSQKRL